MPRQIAILSRGTSLAWAGWSPSRATLIRLRRNGGACAVYCKSCSTRSSNSISVDVNTASGEACGAHRLIMLNQNMRQLKMQIGRSGSQADILLVDELQLTMCGVDTNATGQDHCPSISHAFADGMRRVDLIARPDRACADHTHSGAACDSYPPRLIAEVTSTGIAPRHGQRHRRRNVYDAHGWPAGLIPASGRGIPA